MKRTVFAICALLVPLSAFADALWKMFRFLLHFTYVNIALFSTYSNGLLYPGGNWASAFSTSLNAPTVTSGVLHPTALNDTEAGYWTANTFDNNQWETIKVGTLASNVATQGALIRVSAGNNFYDCFFIGPTGASAQWEITKVVSGTLSVLAGPTTATLNVGDAFGCEVIGTTLVMKQFLATGGNGIVLDVLTDTSLTSGAPGVAMGVISGSVNDSGITEVTGGNLR